MKCVKTCADEVGSCRPNISLLLVVVLFVFCKAEHLLYDKSQLQLPGSFGDYLRLQLTFKREIKKYQNFPEY